MFKIWDFNSKRSKFVRGEFIGQLDPAEDFGGLPFAERLGNQNVYNNLSIQLYDSQLGLLTSSKGNERYTPFKVRTAGICLGILTILLIVVICIRQSLVLNRARICEDGEFHVFSINDLFNTPEDCQTIRILTLEESTKSKKFPRNNIQILQNGPIILDISSSMNSTWLPHIMNRFQTVQILNIDVDSICSDNDNLNNNFSMSSLIVAPNLRYLKMYNSRKFQIISWILSGVYPQLKHVEFYNVNFNYEVFQNLLNFVDKTESTVEEIEINRSHLCQECDVSQFSLNDSLKVIKVSNPVEFNLD